MKKCVLLLATMMTMVFSLSSCGDDDKGEVLVPSEVTVSDIVEAGDRMFYRITVVAYGQVTERTYTAYFDENDICVKGEMKVTFPNSGYAKTFYEEQKQEGNTPEIYENEVRVPYEGYLKKDRKTVRMAMEEEKSLFGKIE